MTSRPATAALLVGCALAAAPAGAETSARQAPEHRSLKSFFGVDAVRPLLRAEDGETRERAFERLGTLGTPTALELLARALDGDGAARDARERLAVVRALAPHAADPTAEDALIRALGGVEGHVDARALLVEQTAALALAAAGSASGIAALARALRRPGRVSEHAALALTAHPPRDASVLLDVAGIPTPALVTVLGELGGARALGIVQKLAVDGSAALREAAVPALYRLAPERAVALARSAFAAERAPDVRSALARVLVESNDATGPTAFAALLADPATRARALDLALASPHPELGPALARAPLGDDTDRLLAALGAAAGEAALTRLEQALARPADAWSALDALAQSPDGAASDVLERALARPGLRRDALRAAALRAVARGASAGGTSAARAALARGGSADRAAAAFFDAATDSERGAQLLASRDPAEVLAAARAAAQPALAPLAAARLAAEKDPTLRAALAIALAVPAAADLVPTRILVELLETRGAATDLAAYALAERDSDTVRPRLRELLASDDPVLRAHVALGLAASSEPSAVGLLADSYRFEPDPGVRRAIVQALAARTEPARRRTLELARALDPDEEARAIATSALSRTPAPALTRDGTVWLRFAATEPPRFAVIRAAGGLALPYAADPDGMLTAAALAPGPLDVSVARATPGLTKTGGAEP